jgi:YceI-like domain
MPIGTGKHTLGPDSGVLMIQTRKRGAAAKAGHNLLIGVTSWAATLDVGEDDGITLTVDPRSLVVIEGTGGMMELGDEEKDAIEQTIGQEVLTDGAIEFRSTRVAVDGDSVSVEGELELVGTRHPVAFELSTEDGRLTGSATVKQTAWGIEPYTALFGTLKVADDVEVSINAVLPRRDDHG